MTAGVHGAILKTPKLMRQLHGDTNERSLVTLTACIEGVAEPILRVPVTLVVCWCYVPCTSFEDA